MILIISSTKDVSTQIVIDYLLYMDKEFILINEKNFASGFSYRITNNLNSFEINTHFSNIDFNSISSYWYRRGDLIKLNLIKEDLLGIVNTHLNIENEIITSSVENEIKTKLSFGSFIDEIKNDKLVDLKNAKLVELRIPETLITTSKNELLDFFKKNGKLIVKPIKNPFSFKYENEIYTPTSGIEILDDRNIRLLEHTFYPVFVQEYVEKEYEVRVFFINGNLYAMAMFSQNSNDTRVDYRNEKETEIRKVPYSLPDNIKTKLMDFIKISNLSTGSIDIIVNEKDEHVFLEVNPSGQFGWVSRNCNYYLEEKIAKLLK